MPRWDNTRRGPGTRIALHLTWGTVELAAFFGGPCNERLPRRLNGCREIDACCTCLLLPTSTGFQIYIAYSRSSDHVCTVEH